MKIQFKAYNGVTPKRLMRAINKAIKYGASDSQCMEWLSLTNTVALESICQYIASQVSEADWKKIKV